MKKIILLSTAAIIIASPAFSREGPQDAEIIISASRIAQSKDQVGSSVTVITRADIEKSGASQVYDLLKNVVGVSVNRSGGAGSTSNIRLRGSEVGQVRVLIDGILMNDPSDSFAAYDYSGLLINNIERIEILRGPQSALYGSDAMGGVINIITRRGVGPAKFSAQAEVGSYGTYREALGVHGAKDKVDYAFQVQNFDTQGFSRAAHTSEKDGTSNQAFNGAVGVAFNENAKVDVSGYYSYLESDYDDYLADGKNDLQKTTLSGKAALTLKTLDGKWEHIFSQQAASTQNEYSQPASASFRTSAYDGLQNTSDYQSNIKLRARDVLTAGVTHEKQSVKTLSTSNVGVITQGADRSFITNSVYGQYLLGLGEHSTITAGGRHDAHSQFGAENTYRVTAAQELPDTNMTLRSSYGTAFKAPTLYQLFDPTYGTPSLSPETSKGYDIGVDQKFLSKKLELGATYFHNDYKNMIVYDFGTNHYNNVTAATTNGIEATARYELTPEWSLHSAYTYLLGENDTTTRTLTYRPKHTGVVGADYEVLGKGSVGGDMRYVSRQLTTDTGAPEFVKSYATLDLRASYDVTPQVAVYTRIENLLDKDYQETSGYNAPGASIYAGVKANY